jgi:predicted ATP-grasp superfamily ATP-dependent carboligase
MHLFVYEYLSSGAVGWVERSETHRSAPVGLAALDSPYDSLQTEGWSMLSAMLEDLASCPGVQISTLLDCHRGPPRHWSERLAIHFLQPAAEQDSFRKLAAAADWSLVIAPEFDGILAERSRWVEAAGGRLLGCSPKAIDETADKLYLAQLWRSHGIPTPQLEPTLPSVIKPRFGAGSQATFLVHNEEELERARLQAKVEGWSGELMMQRYTPGFAASVSFLAGTRKRHSLPAAEQRLSRDGRFRYLGGCLPLPNHLDRRARRLAERAAECIEGLNGWFGVDLILGDAEDGSGDVAIEINPRLTTSYLGLRRLARFNLAASLIAAATGSPMLPWEWQSGPIDFCAGG